MRSVSGWWPVLGLLCALAGAPVQAQPADALEFARRVRVENDHDGLPFAVVDKRNATIRVYRSDGKLVGHSTVLIGATPGDRSVPGVGQRAQSGNLTVADRTTAAGRFRSEPGRNRNGEAIVWLDYENALAIHRLRPGRAYEARLKGLASNDNGLKRMSDGCVVVPESFYDRIVGPVLGRGPAIVYVLPEEESWQAAWDTLTTAGAF
jgi:hypothetical protein